MLISATFSSRGGSFYLLTQYGERYQFVINDYVFGEATRAIRTKFPHNPALRRSLFELLVVSSTEVVVDPNRDAVLKSAKILDDPSDAPILATALQECDYLLTLDNGFFGVQVVARAQQTGLKIVKPRDLIRRG